jgi:hypothetical protein
MTDRFQGFVVTLSADLREDDMKDTLMALRMIRGVIDVRPVTASIETDMATARARTDLMLKIGALLRDRG